jgi:hypothetical protein
LVRFFEAEGSVAKGGYCHGYDSFTILAPSRKWATLPLILFELGGEGPHCLSASRLSKHPAVLESGQTDLIELSNKGSRVDREGIRDSPTLGTAKYTLLVCEPVGADDSPKCRKCRLKEFAMEEGVMRFELQWRTSNENGGYKTIFSGNICIFFTIFRIHFPLLVWTLPLFPYLNSQPQPLRMLYLRLFRI